MIAYDLKPAFAPVVGMFTEKTATSSMRLTVERELRPARIVELGAGDLRSEAALKKIDLLVLPGITREESPYHAALDAAASANIRTRVEAGLFLLGSCAGSYPFSPEFSYVSAYKQAFGMKGMGLFDGSAYGPVDATYPHVDPGMNYGAMRVMRLSFNDCAGRAREAGVLYHNGPALLPSPLEENKLDIIARYADVPGTPIAIAGKVIGKGYAVFCGPLPEIALDHAPLPPGGVLPPAIMRLRNAIEPHEQDRQALMAVIAGKFRARWSKPGI